MSFNIVPNTHCRIWKNNVVAPGPPVGVATYDGPGQLLRPFFVSGLPKPWRGRLAILPSALAITNADIGAAGTQCWLQYVDDSAPANWGYFQIVDMSVSMEPDVAIPGNFKATALFLAFIISS